MPAAATSGPITVSTPGGTATSAASFTVIPAPTLTFFTPAFGPVGTAVTVIGSGFTGASAVTFNGTAATSFSVASPTQLTATVPATATTGPIAVSAPGGSVTSAASFTVVPAPSLSKLRPAAAKRGATVTLSGTGFGALRGASLVKLGGRSCTVYLSWSEAQIKCKVPARAAYGLVTVTVTTAAGTSNALSFTVKR